MMMDTPTTFIALPEETMAHLLALRLTPNETLVDVIQRVSAQQVEQPSEIALVNPDRNSEPLQTGRYCLYVFDNKFFAESLGEVLAIVLNFFADLDDDFLERVEKMGGRTRRHTGQNRDDIHPGRPDLNEKFTRQFRPGWWIGVNYSKADTCRILKDICGAAGLKYGQDVKLG